MASPPEVVRSRANPLVRRLRALKQRADPAGGLMLLEGPKLLDEALRSGVQVIETAFGERVAGTPAVGALEAALRARGLAPRLLADALLSALSDADATQGVLAVARRPRGAEADLFAPAEPLLLVLAGVQNPGNLGGLLRTAEAAGAHGALLCDGCADPFSWKALRGAMGSAFRLPLLALPSLEEALVLLRARGVRVAATVAPHTPGAQACFDVDWHGPLALVFGNESAGLPEPALLRVDERITIPLAGGVESLNVGVAAGVLLFAAARQRARA